MWDTRSRPLVLEGGAGVGSSIDWVIIVSRLYWRDRLGTESCKDLKHQPGVDRKGTPQMNTTKNLRKKDYILEFESDRILKYQQHEQIQTPLNNFSVNLVMT